MAFDGIVTKMVANELQNLSGARIDKIFQPNKNNILIGCYLNKTNYLINICIDSGNYRIHLTTHPKSNPTVAPNFCMVLRKHLLGLHIKNVITNNLERVVTIEFEGFDEVDDIISKKLIIELMGKHCNVIILDEQNIIIDSMRHIYQEDSNRNIIPHLKYTYPDINKKNFLDCTDFSQFLDLLPAEMSIDSFPLILSNIFNGFSKSFISGLLQDLSINDLSNVNLEKIYNVIRNIVFENDTNCLDFKYIDVKGKKDYYLSTSSNEDLTPFHLNFFLDDFYFEKESSQEFRTYRDSVLKMILGVLDKYKKRLNNMNKKLAECDDMQKYQLYGELITANLYRIENRPVTEVVLENYYDNNKEITIKLDGRYSPSINAKRFFKKYNKLKNTLEIVTKQKNDTLNELDYIESIIYELEAATTLDEVYSIFEEIAENVIFAEKTKQLSNKKKNKIKKSTLTKNKNVSFNPIKYTIGNYQLLVGRNNKENDYLTLKYASKNDIWFHTKDIHGSHAILKLNSNNDIPNEDILVKCAEIVALHSKAKNSSNVPVDYCEVRYVKKPNGAKPGMVIYTHNHTLYVNPKNN